jgi:tetratricopeptide (TPR) repeat protein
LDPGLVAAQVDLAHCIVGQELCGFMSPRVAADRIRNIVRDAGDPSPALLPSLGWVAFHVDRDLGTALEMFSQSAQMPHDTWTTRLRVLLALSLHRYDEAAEWLRSALLVDPYAPWLHARLAWTCHLAGDAPESMARLDEALELFPDHDSTRFYGSILLAFHGEARRAEKMAEELVRRAPYLDMAAAVHAYTLARAGRPGECREMLERLQWLSRERFVLRSFTPAACVALGDIDGALSELRAADEARCPWLFEMLADSRLNALRGHPEFEQMRASVAQVQEAGSEVS